MARAGLAEPSRSFRPPHGDQSENLLSRSTTSGSTRGTVFDARQTTFDATELSLQQSYGVTRLRAALNTRFAAYAAEKNDVDASGALFNAMLAIMVVSLLGRMLLVAASGVPTTDPDALYDAAAFVALLPLSIALSRAGLREASLVLRSGAILSLGLPFSSTMCIVVFHIGRSFPLADAALQTFDQRIGFDWLAYARFVDAKPLLWNSFDVAYNSVYAQFVAVTAILAFQRSATRLYTFLLAQIVTLSLVAAVSIILPAIGAYEQSGAAHAALIHQDFGEVDSVTSSILWLRQATFGSGGVTAPTLISFPSYHACCAAMFVFATWRTPYLKWPFLGINLAMLASTPVQGSHYLVDVICGVTITIFSICLSSAVINAWSRRFSD